MNLSSNKLDELIKVQLGIGFHKSNKYAILIKSEYAQQKKNGKSIKQIN